MSTVGLISRVLVFAGCLGFATLTVAQNQPAPKTKAAPPAAPASPEAQELQTLMQTRAQLGTKLESLRAEINAAIKAKDLKQRDELIEKFDTIVSEFRTKTLPKMLAVAGPLYLKDPKNAEAEVIVLGNLEEMFHENKYKQVIADGSKYLMAGRNHPLILNVVGVSYFAQEDFEKADALLKQAKAAAANDENAQDAFSSIGAPYLPQCKSYAAMWKTELAIRQKEAAAKGDARLPRVLFKTTKGDIELELFENEAPNTVANFISLVEKKKYDGIKFHRVIPSFMAQGGDPNTLDNDPSNDGMGGPGYHIACECYQENARMHFQGSLSMAHAGKDTGGSQFFLTHLPTGHLNPNPDVPSGHTVFGRVVKGMDVMLSLRQMDRIISATVLFKRNHPYIPKTIKS